MYLIPIYLSSQVKTYSTFLLFELEKLHPIFLTVGNTACDLYVILTMELLVTRLQLKPHYLINCIRSHRGC